MTLYIGGDIHARQQTVIYLDQEDGTRGQEFCLKRQRELLSGVLIWKAARFWRACSGSILLLGSSKRATYLTQKRIEIPNNVT